MKLLTVIEVSSQLGIKKRTLDNWRQSGEGPKWVKLGGLVRYRQEDVYGWVEEKEHEMPVPNSRGGRR